MSVSSEANKFDLWHVARNIFPPLPRRTDRESDWCARLLTVVPHDFFSGVPEPCKRKLSRAMNLSYLTKFAINRGMETLQMWIRRTQGGAGLNRMKTSDLDGAENCCIKVSSSFAMTNTAQKSSSPYMLQFIEKRRSCNAMQYRAPLKCFGQVWWTWGEKIAFSCLQQAG